jgi:prophage antirepressor-like protein
METNIQIFKNGQFGEVRVTEIDGELHFVAKDVAETLGYKWQPNLVGHIPEEWRGINPINTLSGKQDVITLSEQGLYFFLGRSDKPAALPYQKWIAGEVIPSIRKTGAYATQTAIASLSRKDLALMVIQSEEENERLQGEVQAQKQLTQILEGEKEHLTAEVKQLAPKAEYTDKVLQSTSTYTATQVAKELGMSAIALGRKLHDAGIMFKQSGQWMLYAKYQDKGYTSTRTKYYQHDDGTTGSKTETVWTERGRAFVHWLFDSNKIPRNKQTVASNLF